MVSFLMKQKRWFLYGLVAVFFASCQTYYSANIEFNQAFQAGDFQKCEDWLEKHKPGKRSKEKFLYQSNLGMVRFILNKPEPSNEALENAFLLVEDFEKNPGEYAASLLTNPKRITYTGERFERLMINYLKALNQFKSGNTEAALVETRRLIRRMNVLEEAKKDDYRTDGFMLWMIGQFFEAAGEINNAYIYYRKAHIAYETVFAGLAKVQEPQQLKMDLVRAAFASGFDEEARQFEAKFRTKNRIDPAGNGTVLLLWHKGLGPVKDEDRISLSFVKGAGGQLSFENTEYGFAVPFVLPVGESQSRFNDLKFITMALPKYLNRNAFWTGLSAKVGEERYGFQPATNFESIAKADLHDRMGRELLTAVTRVALKQTMQYAATKATEAAVESGKGDRKKKAEQAELAGSLVDLAFTIANAATEVADTRNWQTLPAQIEVLRVSLPPGRQIITLYGTGKDGKDFTQPVELEVKPGQTIFHTIHTF